MKNFMFMLMAVGMMMFTACGSKSTTPETPPTTDTTNVDVVPAQKPNDTIPAPVDRDTAIQ